MEMTVEDYLAQLAGDRVQVTTDQTDARGIQQEVTMKRGLTTLADQLAAGYLAQFEWQVKVPVGDPLSVRLETNLINVPMVDAPRLDGKLLDKDRAYPVQVYMVAEGEELNQSGLRIDQLMLATDLVDQPTAKLAELSSWVADQLLQLLDNRSAKAAEEG